MQGPWHNRSWCYGGRCWMGKWQPYVHTHWKHTTVGTGLGEAWQGRLPCLWVCRTGEKCPRSFGTLDPGFNQECQYHGCNCLHSVKEATEWGFMSTWQYNWALSGNISCHCEYRLSLGISAVSGNIAARKLRMANNLGLLGCQFHWANEHCKLWNCICHQSWWFTINEQTTF